MVVEVNYLAVLVAALLSMVLGSIWYGPLFGKPWMKMMGISSEKVRSMSGAEMGKLYGIQFIGSLVMAYVLVHSLAFASYYLNISGLNAGIQGGFYNWLGFVAPVTLTTVLWEGKSWKLWFLNNGYYLTLLVTMSIVLSLWV